MESENREVSARRSVSLVEWILRIIGLPFTVVSLVFNFLTTHRLKNALPGKVVLITGASSGLGEALAHTFYIAGCKVVLAARRQDELERVRKDLLQLHSVSTRSLHHPTFGPAYVNCPFIDAHHSPACCAAT